MLTLVSNIFTVLYLPLTDSTLISFSTPFINSIYFLYASQIRYGAFGYCVDSSGCIKPVLGYSGPGLTEWLTRTHIMYGLGTYH